MTESRITIWATALLLGALAGGLAVRAQETADKQTREVMKAKLGHAHAVLEGIALEDFAKVQISAERLARLSQAAGWHARQTPEYVLFTEEFRRRAQALAEAARAGNLDGATLAYTQLTFSCVSCHKYMRGRRIARLDTLDGPRHPVSPARTGF
jgi:cytochrome c556